MLKIALSAICGVVVITSALVFFEAGVFDRVKLIEEQRGPYNLVYKEYFGSYSAVGPRIKTVHQYLSDVKKVENIKGGFALFYDNPIKKGDDSLRSICGVITDSVISVESPYKSSVYGKSYCIVGKYPLRSYFSYMTGIYKIYSSLEKYAKTKNVSISGPVMEMIDTNKKYIYYVSSVSSTAVVPVYGK